MKADVYNTEAIDIGAQEKLWKALTAPIDVLALRQALQSGASANLNCHHPELSPLEAAVEGGCLKACAILVEYGARVDVKAVDDGRSLLHRAIASLGEDERHPIIDYLLSVGVDPLSVTLQDQSVLDWAIMWGDEELIAKLRSIEEGSSIQD